MKRTEYSDAFQNGYSATRRFLLSRGAAVDEAEEIAQAAWARGWEYRDQLRDPSMVSFWVNSIARNLFRARFRTPPVLPLDGIDPSYTMSLEEQIEVRRILDLCPKRDRALLEKSLEGYSAEEMARDEGISSTGIRVRMLRIRQGIRAQLAIASLKWGLMPPGTLLQLRHVSKDFATQRAVADVSLEVPRGAFFSLLGPSGCGKTTILRMIAGFETPTSGEVWLNGQRIDALPPYQRNVNTVFQSYALFPHLTVQGNVEFGLRRTKRGPKGVRRHKSAKGVRRH